MTNALNIASELAIRANLKLVVTGGDRTLRVLRTGRPARRATLERLNVDVAFVGVDGISVEAGLTTHHEIEAHTNRTLMEHARRVVVVADGSKIGTRRSPGSARSRRSRSSSPTRAPRAEALREIREGGVDVTIA